jgi:hypothetical protein
MLGLAGVTAMEDKVAEVTVRVVLPEILPEVAVMVAAPAAMAVARPLLFTVATAISENPEALDEVQVTWVVILWLVPSEYVPEAANCSVIPAGTLGLAGVTDMEDKVAEVTVRVVLPEILPEVAVMVAVPAAMAVARPLLFTVATDVLDELQATWVVMLWLVPSEYVPEAANCLVIPAGTLGLAGVADMERSVAVGAAGSVPVPPPHPTKLRKSTSRRLENKSFTLIIHTLCPLPFYFQQILCPQVNGTVRHLEI